MVPHEQATGAEERANDGWGGRSDAGPADSCEGLAATVNTSIDRPVPAPAAMSVLPHGLSSS